jgi:hypothetical protein
MSDPLKTASFKDIHDESEPEKGSGSRKKQQQPELTPAERKAAQNVLDSKQKQIEEDKKQRVAATIMRYYQRFPDLAPKNIPAWGKLTLSDCNAELSRIKSILCQTNSDKTASFYAGLFFLGTEKTCSSLFGMEMTGFADQMMAEINDFEDEIKELMCLYPWLFEQPLFMRIGVKLGEKIYRHHLMATAAKTTKQSEDPKPSIPVPEEFRDL